jgi:hypothetical protein
MKTLGADPPIGASPKPRPSTPGKSPRKSPYNHSPYASNTGAGSEDRYQIQSESPSQPISEAERYYRKVLLVSARRSSLSALRIQQKDGNVFIQRMCTPRTMNLVIPFTWELMRNLYMLFALSDDNVDALATLIGDNFADYSDEPSPILEELNWWR